MRGLSQAIALVLVLAGIVSIYGCAPPRYEDSNLGGEGGGY